MTNFEAVFIIWKPIGILKATRLPIYMQPASLTTHSRYDVLHGYVKDAPSQCGRPKRDGKKCTHVPTFSTEHGFSCGMHTEFIIHPSTECPICYDTVSASKTTTTLCGHVFCKKCLKKWNSISCPICRQAIREPTDAEIRTQALLAISEEILLQREVVLEAVNNLLDNHDIPNHIVDNIFDNIGYTTVRM